MRTCIPRGQPLKASTMQWTSSFIWIWQTARQLTGLRVLVCWRQVGVEPNIRPPLWYFLSVGGLSRSSGREEPTSRCQTVARTDDVYNCAATSSLCILNVVGTGWYSVFSCTWYRSVDTGYSISYHLVSIKPWNLLAPSCCVSPLWRWMFCLTDSTPCPDNYRH